MSEIKSVLPSAYDFVSKYMWENDVSDLNKVALANRIAKAFAELVRNATLEEAANKAKTKAFYKKRGARKYKEWKGESINLFDTDQMFKVDKCSILSLKDSETLKVH